MSENSNNVNKNNLPPRPQSPVPPTRPNMPSKQQGQAESKPVDSKPVQTSKVEKVNSETKETKHLQVEESSIANVNTMTRKVHKSKKVVFLSVLCTMLTIALASVILFMFVLQPKEHTITYLDIDMQSVYETTTIKHGDKLDSLVKYESSDPNLIFMGWYLDDSYENRITSGTKIEKDYILYPKFRYEYKITYKDINLIDVYKVEKFDHDDIVLLEDGPTNENSYAVFKGWYTDSEFTNRFVFGTTINQDYTLYPLFENKYKIIYKNVDLTSTYLSEEFDLDDVTQEPTPPTHESVYAEFVGWYTDEDFTNKFVFGTTINQDYTLYPLFENLEGLEFTEIKDGEENVIGYSVAQGSFSGSELTIPNTYKGKPVTAISDEGFAYNSTITNITFPSGITTIGEGAFASCVNLTLSQLPNTITKLEDYAFFECTNLALTSLPNRLTEIPDNAFWKCTNLALTSLPTSLETIGMRAFYHCTSLVLNNLIDGVESIGISAFQGCTNLVLTSIPNSVNTICHRAFQGCTSLKYIKMSNSLTTFDTSVFTDCTSLQYVLCDSEQILTLLEDGNVDESILYVKKITGYEGLAFASEVEINDTLTIFADTTTDYTWVKNGDNYYQGIYFTNVSGLAFTEIKDGENVVAYSVGQGTFSGSELVVPDKFNDLPVIEVAKDGFKECTLEKITLPDSIKVINEYAFYHSTNLTINVLPNSLEVIGEKAFWWCTSIAFESLPDSVTTIGDSAFFNTNITLKALPASLKSIGECAFQNCKLIEIATLPQGLESIGGGAFYGCNSMTEITIPASVNSIGYMLFSRTAISKIEVDDKNPIYNDGNGSNVIIESATNKLVTGCNNSIIPEGVNVIGEWSLSGLTFFSLTIPANVDTIETEAFNSSNIDFVNILGDSIILAKGVFNSCNPYDNVHDISYILCTNNNVVESLIASGVADISIYVKVNSGYESLAFASEIEISDTLTIFVDTTTDYTWVRSGEDYYKCLVASD